jgi:long-chain acyl-CoA synthetase
MGCIHTLSDIYKLCLSNKWSGKIKILPTGDCVDASSINDRLTLISEKLTFYSIGSNEKVLVLVSSNIDIVLLMIALWAKGAVVVPVKKGTSRDAINEIGKNCNAHSIIRYDDNLLIDGFPFYKEKPSFFSFKTEPRVSGNDLAFVIYTSGSTS